jgi:hypothetical protein
MKKKGALEKNESKKQLHNNQKNVFEHLCDAFMASNRLGKMGGRKRIFYHALL